MAASSNRKKTTTKNNNNKKPAGNRTRNTKQMQETKKKKEQLEILTILLFALSVFIFLCNFGLSGSFGVAVKKVLFGLFGIISYIIPFVLFFGIIIYVMNKNSKFVKKKVISGAILLYMAGVLIELFSYDFSLISGENIFKELYTLSAHNFSGGGVLPGILTYFLYQYLSKAGTILVVLVISVICIVIMTEKSLVGQIKRSSEKVYENAIKESEKRKQKRMQKALEDELSDDEDDIIDEDDTDIDDVEIEVKKPKRMDKRVTGVMKDLRLEPEVKKNEIGGDNLHEIILNEEEEEQTITEKDYRDMMFDDTIPEPKGLVHSNQNRVAPVMGEKPVVIEKTVKYEKPEKPAVEVENRQQTQNKTQQESTPFVMPQGKRPAKKYVLPPTSLLNKTDNSVTGDSPQQLKETAMRLKQTLEIFGVKVTITDISKGPAVTRYEVQPELGVKVSKIVALADDIKLNLAATDIRIEAPIPGKAAVGIEVPNKENTAVGLRELLESPEFKKNQSNIPFAVGKDLAGQTVVADIAKMLHVLIAGATGSGKSVCINTLIVSILYRANPEDVKFIMIDPKVVELSVFNGIPHLLLPVVTDPKKAAGALHWGVEEMTRRYKVFADYNVKDLAHYNAKAEELRAVKGDEAPPKMPQIVIIVDELADLMMAAQQSVEESICRLAQLARAAGIHLIIATQRPSVDVITGLIKANMPSRIAFSVASGVDSRTILDMNGAEKLLGKGDMLFYPQGMNKPTRIQGAFVSDKEVVDIVDFIKSQDIIIEPQEDLASKMNSFTEGGNGGFSSQDGGSEYDPYFADAGRLILEKDKASIGMLQRAFKIGFNRAARIMDQLCEAGVVSEEESTKPRTVLMSPQQFEDYISEYL